MNKLIKLIPVLLLVFGLLIYVGGCVVDSMAVELFGSFFLFLGIAIFAERKWEKQA